MLTQRQKMQIKRTIGFEYGFKPEAIELTKIEASEVQNKHHEVEINVEFKHIRGFEGKEVFAILPSDSRKIPLLVKEEQ